MKHYWFYHTYKYLLKYLLTELAYLLVSIPLPVYNSVCFTSILFFYAFDYTGLNLGLISFGLSLTRLGWSQSQCQYHTP